MGIWLFGIQMTMSQTVLTLFSIVLITAGFTFAKELNDEAVETIKRELEGGFEEFMKRELDTEIFKRGEDDVHKVERRNWFVDMYHKAKGWFKEKAIPWFAKQGQKAISKWAKGDSANDDSEDTGGRSDSGIDREDDSSSSNSNEGNDYGGNDYGNNDY